MFKKRLFTPGPTPLLPQVQQALSKPILHHRTDEFRLIFKEVLGGLRYLYNTTGDVLLFTSSATGVMEGSIANLLNHSQEAIVISTGKFGERWVEICQAYGVKTNVLSCPYGQIINASTLAAELEKFPKTRAVLVQHSESSTGVKLDIEGFGKIVRQFKHTALVVDAVTGLGVMPLPVDRWNLDIVIAGSQKALMMPPGLAFVSISKKAWQLIKENQHPKYYFDFSKEKKLQLKGETAYTPSTSLVVALKESLRFIQELTREELIKNTGFLAQVTRAAATQLGLTLFAQSSPSDALTAIYSPEGMDSGMIIDKLKEGFGAIVANGQDSMKGKIFRIAHLGYNDFPDILALIACLELVLIQLGIQVKLGTGVQAVQKIYLSQYPVDPSD